MTERALVIQSLRFRWRAHLGVVLGAAVGSAALIGALVVGDSMRGSLREQAMARLGHVWYALAPFDRFVTESLPARMPGWLRDSWRTDHGQTWVHYATKPAGVLLLPAMISRQDQSARVNRVNLLGVGYDPTAAERDAYVSFWHFGLRAEAKAIPPGDIWLNEALAAQLRARVGDTLVVRVKKPGLLSREVPITPQAEGSASARLRVGEVRRATEMGSFSLRVGQAAPLNAFMNLEELQRLTGTTGRVNLLVAPEVVVDRNIARGRLGRLLDKVGLGRLANALSGRPSTHLDTTEALLAFQADLKAHLHLADLEAELRLAPGPTVELVSRRIFLDPPLARAALLSNSTAQPVLTYLVNQFRSGTNTTPYSMVTAAGAPWTPPGMRDNEILVNQWLADDLRLKPGDAVDLTYFLPESGSRLVERTNTLRVRGVVPLADQYADRTLMPEFPGLAKAESTHDWEAGFPLVHRIRDHDELYWKQHRGTPKAFVTLAAGQAMWGNRFGNVTAIRFPIPTNLMGQAVAASSPKPTNGLSAFRRGLEHSILAGLKPEEMGLRFEPVRAQALEAAAQSQDFGGLFLAFSFFLIAAALILMGLLFQFGLEQRAVEVGTLLALGFTPTQVRRLFLLEGTGLALVGGVAGALGGLAYARLMLHGLATLWRDAVGTSALGFFAAPASLVIGLVAAVLVSALTVWLVLRRQARSPARELLAGGGRADDGERGNNGGSRAWASVMAWVCFCAGVGIAGWALWQGETGQAGAFFGAGTLCLIGALAGLSRGLARLNTGAASARSDLLGFALRNCARRRSRSLAVAALLACGVFIVASIGVFRLEADRQAWQRASGTGGFALVGESTLPVIKDLNTAEGREAFGLDETALASVSFVSFRVREGDDASCLNLNRARQPRLLGVNPEALAGRGAFTFVKVAKGHDLEDGWRLLRGEAAPGAAPSREASGPPEIPAIGDAASIQWALHKKVGETLDYTDEQGRRFKLRLVGAVANSILQGSLIIDEREFTRRFPGETGSRFFLVDAPSNRVEAVSALLSRALQDTGLELTPSARRLAQFNAVQNTYLNTFQVLGGIGLLLGSAGLGVVVLRNALERRAELALLLAVGFRRRLVQTLVVSEHAALLAAGLVVGVGAAAVAVLPALRQTPGDIPWLSLVLTFAGVLTVGLLATLAGTFAALRGSLLESLRQE